jgi:hypothetical protein
MKKEQSKVEVEKVCLNKEEKPKSKAAPILASNNQLLRDIATVFTSTQKLYLSTSQIKKKLSVDTTKPWHEYYAGRCITKKMIDTILKRNNICKYKITINNFSRHVYSADLFMQYQS